VQWQPGSTCTFRRPQASQQPDEQQQGTTTRALQHTPPAVKSSQQVPASLACCTSSVGQDLGSRLVTRMPGCHAFTCGHRLKALYCWAHTSPQVTTATSTLDHTRPSFCCCAPACCAMQFPAVIFSPTAPWLPPCCMACASIQSKALLRYHLYRLLTGWCWLPVLFQVAPAALLSLILKPAAAA